MCVCVFLLALLGRLDYLHSAHTLRNWCADIGLFVLPRTGELLISAPHLNARWRSVQSFPQSSMIHDMYQHWPVSLTKEQLTDFDHLILSSSESPNAVAEWMAEHLTIADTPKLIPSDCVIPMWLVACQHLLQINSPFIEENRWTELITAWLNQRNLRGNSNDFGDLNHFLKYVPSSKQKAGFLAACLSNKRWETFSLVLFCFPCLNSCLLSA